VHAVSLPRGRFLTLNTLCYKSTLLCSGYSMQEVFSRTSREQLQLTTALFRGLPMIGTKSRKSG
jgi:hypothetical protein